MIEGVVDRPVGYNADGELALVVERVTRQISVVLDVRNSPSDRADVLLCHDQQFHGKV